MKKFIGNYFNAWDEINVLYGNGCHCSYDTDCSHCKVRLRITLQTVFFPLFVMAFCGFVLNHFLGWWMIPLYLVFHYNIVLYHSKGKTILIDIINDLTSKFSSYVETCKKETKGK